MDYTLYHSDTSPYVRKVCVLLDELDLLKTTKKVAGLTAEAKADHPNPLIKIPTLITPDCGILFDSTVICEYLDLKHAKGKYFPGEFDLRMKTLTVHALTVGIIDATVAMVYETRRESTLQNPQVFEVQSAKISRGLDHLEQAIDFVSSHWNIATINVAIMLDYLDFRQPGKFPLDNYDGLKAWRNSLRSAAIDKTMPFES